MVCFGYSYLLYIAQPPRTELSVQKYCHRFTHHGNRESRNISRYQSLEILRCSFSNGSNRSYSRYCGHYLFWNRIICSLLSVQQILRKQMLSEMLSVCVLIFRDMKSTSQVSKWLHEFPRCHWHFSSSEKEQKIEPKKYVVSARRQTFLSVWNEAYIMIQLEQNHGLWV